MQNTYILQERSTHASLRGQRRLTWVDTFCRYIESHFHRALIACISPGSVNDIAGAISMDAMTVKVQKYCDRRTAFCLLSNNIEHINSCYGLASLADSFICDILANINRRVPKLYLQHGEITKGENVF